MEVDDVSIDGMASVAGGYADRMDLRVVVNGLVFR
jgi:hypothetical protein